VVRVVDNGSEIYTDRPCVFSNLPARLRRKTALLTPNEDRGREGGRVVSFKVTEEAEVYLLYDVSGRGGMEGTPGWVEREGWRKVVGLPLIVVNTQRHEEGVIKFQVYRKHVGKMEEVVLGGNAAAAAAAAGGGGGGKEGEREGGSRSRNNNYAVVVVQQPMGGGGGGGEGGGEVGGLLRQRLRCWFRRQQKWRRRRKRRGKRRRERWACCCMTRGR